MRRAGRSWSTGTRSASWSPCPCGLGGPGGIPFWGHRGRLSGAADGSTGEPRLMGEATPHRPSLGSAAGFGGRPPARPPSLRHCPQVELQALKDQLEVERQMWQASCARKEVGTTGGPAISSCSPTQHPGGRWLCCWGLPMGLAPGSWFGCSGWWFILSSTECCLSLSPQGPGLRQVLGDRGGEHPPTRPPPGHQLPKLPHRAS